MIKYFKHIENRILYNLQKLSLLVGEIMDKKRTKEVVEFIISFLIEQTGNDFFDKWKERKKVEKVLKDDSENIKRVFLQLVILIYII